MWAKWFNWAMARGVYVAWSFRLVFPPAPICRQPWRRASWNGLLEIGFVEGAEVEILHEGMIGRDPIGVRLDDMRVALRRREADAVLIRVQGAYAEAAE